MNFEQGLWQTTSGDLITKDYISKNLDEPQADLRVRVPIRPLRLFLKLKF